MFKKEPRKSDGIISFGHSKVQQNPGKYLCNPFMSQIYKKNVSFFVCPPPHDDMIILFAAYQWSFILLMIPWFTSDNQRRLFNENKFRSGQIKINDIIPVGKRFLSVTFG